MRREFKFIGISIIGLFVSVTTTQFIRDNYWTGLVGVGLLSTGGFLVAFGFWGSDYAFSVGIGETDQSKQDGTIKGRRGKVYVPFIRNYSPTEWWNLNWLITTIGIFCLIFGGYFLGLVLGRLGL